MTLTVLASFTLAYFIFAASPGPDNLQMVARSIAQGPLAGFTYGIGMTTGVLVFLVLAAFGLSALAEQAGWLMTVLRYGGAAYLIWIGYRTWTAKPEVPNLERGGERQGIFAGFLTGLAMNLGNPKMPIFYVALLPGFVGHGLDWNQIGALSLCILAVEVVVVSGYVWAALIARRLMRTERQVRTVNRACGGVMIGTAVVMAGNGAG